MLRLSKLGLSSGKLRQAPTWSTVHKVKILRSLADLILPSPSQVWAGDLKGLPKQQVCRDTPPRWPRVYAAKGRFRRGHPYFVADIHSPWPLISRGGAFGLWTWLSQAW